MESIIINPTQRAQLHEVADLMLSIYRTLARMRYLDLDWIQPGPHDVSDLIPMYRSLGLEDSIIYLYSILPYIDTGGAEDVDFYDGGEFADFRNRGDVEQGRDPFYCEEDEEILKPWMTPLSMIGNHQTALIYSAKEHCIWVRAQMAHETVDPAFRHPPNAGTQMMDNNEEEDMSDMDRVMDRVMIETDEEISGNEEKDASGKKEEEDTSEIEEEPSQAEGEISDMDDNTEEEEEEEGVYEGMPNRPAGDVLRDINQWYRELKEIPGGGEHSSLNWGQQLTKPLYSKHGWPREDFDGDAFLVDRARANAVRRAKEEAEEPVQKVEILRFAVYRDDGPFWEQLRHNIEAAKTVDEEWLARWKLWLDKLFKIRPTEELKEAEKEASRLCPDGVSQRPEDLPLWELEQLRVDASQMKSCLQSIQKEAREHRQSEQGIGRGMQLRLRHAEMEASIYEQAYEAAKMDAERLCPGKTFTLATGREQMDAGRHRTPAERIEELTKAEGPTRRELLEIRAWMAQLPANANQARTAAESLARRLEGRLEGSEETLRFWAVKAEQERLMDG